ncbi:HNH endonuclease signature motif containing protein [Gammaproteobacteria bacterium AS21]
MNNRIKEVINNELDKYTSDCSKEMHKMKFELSIKNNEIDKMKFELSIKNNEIDNLKSKIYDFENITETDMVEETVIINNDAFVIGIKNLDKAKEETKFDAINHFNKKCPYCEKDLYEVTSIRHQIEIDHFYPLALGGQDVPWNIIPVCKSCNRKKSKKMPYDFLDPDKYNSVKNFLNDVRKNITNNSIADIQELSLIKKHLTDNIDDMKYDKNISKILELTGIENDHFIGNLSRSKESIVFEYMKKIQIYGLNKCYWYNKDRNYIYISITKSYELYVKHNKGKIDLDRSEIRNIFYETIPNIRKATPISIKGTSIRVAIIKLNDIAEPFESFFNKYVEDIKN